VCYEDIQMKAHNLYITKLTTELKSSCITVSPQHLSISTTSCRRRRHRVVVEDRSVAPV